jgi:lysophospholipase L1-like esterase
MRKRFLLSISAVIFVVVLSVIADRVAGIILPSHAPGFIFPRNTTQQFQTPEFSLTVESNSLGFRDREFDLRKPARLRILAIGDSFTFGWGVEANQSWPKVLEAKLRESGHDLEIANLGKPGGSPRNYAYLAEQAVPVLKPDLLIIAVLQGDDLAQLAFPQSNEARNIKRTDKAIKHPRLRAVATRLYPHFLDFLDHRLKSETSLADEWKRDAQTFLTVMTPEQKARLEKLDRQVKDAFLNGELNPALIYLSIAMPEYFLQTMDLNSSKLRPLISEMANQLARIKDAAIRNNAEVVVVSVPYGTYVSPNSFRSRQRLGFSVVSEMLTTSAADDAIRSACETAGVSFYDLTAEFRRASIESDLFFELDGHFNVAGHRHFAEGLMLLLEKKLTAQSGKQARQVGNPSSPAERAN